MEKIDREAVIVSAAYSKYIGKKILVTRFDGTYYHFTFKEESDKKEFDALFEVVSLRSNFEYCDLQSKLDKILTE